MYWWDRAAELLTRKGSALRRFGFVTTNSITQLFHRKVIERYLRSSKPVSIVMAIPDHPWSKTTPDAASVRIAMTVVEAGLKGGLLEEVIQEERLDTDAPKIDLRISAGHINSDLTVGSDVTGARLLKANAELSSNGVMLAGAGFIVSPSEAEHLGLGKRDGLEKHIRDYRNGRDLANRPRNVKVIDLYGLTVEGVRSRIS